MYDLPFSSNSFDLVRMANLSLCIPYEKWSFVLMQVRRVLAPGGRLELIDDQIFFPYGRPPFPELSPTTPKPNFNTPLPDPGPDDDSQTSDSDSCSGDSVETVVAEGDDQCDADSIIYLPPLQDPASEWDNHAATSRGIEAIFEDMLQKKYEIHPRPHEFVPILLSQIFGGSHTDKIGSFAVGIAPEDHMCDTDDSSIGSSDSGGKKIKWLPEIEWETKKGGGEKKEKGHHSSGSSDSILIPPPQNAEVVSAKVTAGLTIDISPTSSRPSTASQSPGLIVYPSTFIPMSAAELEAHASKHLHVLLGCKCALIDYISGFKDDHGERLVYDQELTDLFWDYEWYCTISFSYNGHN
jgi:hypothetical protein